MGVGKLGHRGNSGAGLLPGALRNSRESPLAGGGAGDPPKARAVYLAQTGRLRSRTANCSTSSPTVHAERGQAGRTAVSRGRYAFSDLPGGIDRDVQPILRHQRNPVLPERHLRGKPVSTVCRATSRAVAIGSTNLLFTMIAIVGDRSAGDARKLLLIGAAGHSYLPRRKWRPVFATKTARRPVGMACWWGSSASSPSLREAVIWVYLSEVFSKPGARQRDRALGSFTHWIMNALISAIFSEYGYRQRSGRRSCSSP